MENFIVGKLENNIILLRGNTVLTIKVTEINSELKGPTDAKLSRNSRRASKFVPTTK